MADNSKTLSDLVQRSFYNINNLHSTISNFLLSSEEVRPKEVLDLLNLAWEKEIDFLEQLVLELRQRNAKSRELVLAEAMEKHASAVRAFLDTIANGSDLLRKLEKIYS